MDTEPSLHFEPIEQPRVHEYVAEQIRRQINLRLISPGHALPPERELARMFGVGRATVQQAIEILEADRLVQSKRGRSGGTFVIGTSSDPGSKERLLAKLRSQRSLILQALDYRALVEPEIAAAAAGSRTARDVRTLTKAWERAISARSDEDFMRYDSEFHLAVASATRNRFCLETGERLRLTLNDALIVLPESELWHARSNREHRRILTAIKDGESQTARAAMRKHVRNTDRSIRALFRAL